MAIPPNEPGPSNVWMIYIPIIVFAILSPLLCGMRMWSRIQRGGVGADDYLIQAALIFALASSAVMIVSCQYGFGQHIDNLVPANKIQVLKYFYLCQITYKLSINLTKTSILTLYIRLFPLPHLRLLCVALATLITFYLTASTIVTIFQCTPLSLAYDKSLPGTCIDMQKFWFANSGFNIATDVIILLIPIPPVYRLLMPRVHKIALIGVFMLGGVVVVISCLRMRTVGGAAKSDDITFETESTMWTVVEMNLAIGCACLPMAWALVVGKGREGRRRGKGYYVKSRSHDGSGQGAWARVEGKDGVHVASVQSGDQSSEEYFLNRKEGREGIQKTVQYSVQVEYVTLGVNAVGGGM